MPLTSAQYVILAIFTYVVIYNIVFPLIKNRKQLQVFIASCLLVGFIKNCSENSNNCGDDIFLGPIH